MLAQNFKTAAELGISDDDFRGLAHVLGMLERDEVKHVPIQDKFYRNNKLPVPTKDFLFNMDNLYTVAACGTAACIAGTADLFCGTNFTEGGKWLRGGLPTALEELFCPSACEVSAWPKITVAQAATATRNFLTCGEPRWSEILD
jgi:hypothetical protein